MGIKMVLVLVLAVVCVMVRAGREPRSYKIVSGDSYTWSKSLPQSCSCLESGVALDDCDLFKCTCACDITAGKCDYNCCCDQDCTPDQTDRFNSLDVCSLERHEPSDVQWCYSDLELSKINHRAEIKETDAAEAAITDALCVEAKNLYHEGEFYNNAKTTAASIFSSSSGTKDFEYVDDITTLSVDAYYDQNDTIPAFVRRSNESTMLYNSGYFVVPTPDFSGYCNDQSHGTFENDIPGPFSSVVNDGLFLNIAGKDKPMQCVREFSVDTVTFIEQCEDEQSISRYVTDLYLGTTADAAGTGLTTSDSAVVSVSLGNVHYLDPATGEYTLVTDTVIGASGSVDCPTTAVNSSADIADVWEVCRLGSTDYSHYTLEAGFPLCLNVIKSVRYVVTNSQDAYGTISSVAAHVVVTDVSMGMDFGAGANTTVESTVAQSFMLTFNDVGGGTTSTSRGNAFARTRSGNPGYIMGAPLLWGVVSDTTAAGELDEFVAGFMMPSALSLVGDEPTSSIPLAGSCPQFEEEVGSVGVPFGYDTQTGCTVELTLAELEAACCYENSNCAGTYTSDIVDTNGLPRFLYNNFTLGGYVGIYGNADPLDRQQWLSVADPTQSDERTWSADTLTCSNMYTGILNEYLVARTGERTFPQNKVIAGKASYVQEDWAWTGGVKSGSKTQKFIISASTSFIFKNDQELQGYTPPPPPIIFHMPYDTFYPFDVRNAGSRSTPTTWLVLGLTAIVTLALSLMPTRR
jgi:hypothetical protein